MAEQTEGTVGIWGLASTETAQGLIIESIEETSRSEKNFTKDNKGCRIGRAEYDESVEIEIAGEALAAGGWTQKLGAELALTNLISLALLNEAGPGKTLIDEVKRKRGREAWEGFTVNAEALVFFPGA